MFSVGLYQVCMHYSYYFDPVLCAVLLTVIAMFGAVAGQQRLSTPSTDSLLNWGPEVGSATREPWNADAEISSLAFVLGVVCLGSLSCWKIQPRLSSMLFLMEKFVCPTSHHTWPRSSFPLDTILTDLDMCCQKQGKILKLQDCDSWLQCVTKNNLCYQLCWSHWPVPPSPYISEDHLYTLSWDLANSPRSREIIRDLLYIPFSNNCSNRWAPYQAACLL